MAKKFTNEQFIKKAIETHGDKYDYSLVNYVNSETKVDIICKTHNIFKQIPSNHLVGRGCRQCGINSSAIKHSLIDGKFIEKAKEIHGDRYDYSEVDYIGIKDKVEIICKEHGLYTQIASIHLQGSGCIKCSSDDKRQTKAEFIEKAEKVHGDKYDYSLIKYYRNDKKVEIICRQHEVFSQSPNSHLQGRGCQKCSDEKKKLSRRSNTKIFTERAKEIHGDLYEYSKVVYTNCRNLVEIICPTHGLFTQIAAAHLAGKGCSLCGKTNHWGKQDYIKKAKGRICIFYTLRCFNEKEEFYKIGITMNTVQSRYRAVKDMPYNYEIISEVFGEAGAIWDMEKEEIKKLSSLHYNPKIDFAGSKTECFTQYQI